MINKKDINEMLKPDNLIAVATWMTLGDGCITLPSKGKNAYFQCSHIERNLDYVEMKTALLSNITGTKFTKYFHSGSNSYDLQIRTKCHPVFTKLRRTIYLNKRKVLTTHAIKMLTPLCLAILYQDDGRYNESKSTLSINKPLFSKIELLALAKWVVDTYGIIFRVRRSCVLKDGTIGHELGLRMKDREKFFDLIGPYVVPSMSYKIIGRGSNQAIAA